MSAHTMTRPARARSPRPATRRGRAPRALTARVLVATDGLAAADAALRVASALVARDESEVRVVAALPPLPACYGSVAEGGAVAIALPSDDERRELLRAAVREQVARVAGCDWAVAVEPGPAAQVIARAASRARATLIILGIGRHSPIDRLFGDETSLRVARLARVPVLAVDESAAEPPRRITAGIDFSPASERAARAALALLGGAGTLRLVHVGPSLDPPAVGEHGANWAELCASGARMRLDALAEQFGAPPGVRVERALAAGDVVRVLVGDAERTRGELIAIGAQHHTRLERLLIGSVTARLLRGARCSVLVTPPDRRDAKRRTPREH